MQMRRRLLLGVYALIACVAVAAIAYAGAAFRPEGEYNYNTRVGHMAKPEHAWQLHLPATNNQ